ncbi:hypothetical protein [Marininema halotolerans]|uniref:Uncharacterized protein n=1 Tax=Marininema halotolerans TaxID=1155944 RepID=A0A1I6UNY1_9BACL|nr:hypothetical protein [Marininema halotolerans]SFT03176.1 hypothetical protein SAMN05444972_11858 [Marininema halotolerans]
MEYIEVLICDVRKDNIDELVFNDIIMDRSAIKNSHFYDKMKEEDLELDDILSLKNVLSPFGTGSMFVNTLTIGSILIHDVSIVISFDEVYGDIVFQFPEKEVLDEGGEIDKQRCKEITEYFLFLMNKYNFDSVKLGYDPIDVVGNVLYHVNGKSIVTNEID